MDLIYEKNIPITSSAVDCFDRLKPSCLLDFLQQVAGDHCTLLEADRKTLSQQNLFWAVLRHRVQISRLPSAGETVTLKTWPMPTTRTAYPRATAAFDADGNQLFRCVSLWVLMDTHQRMMVLPAKSGVVVDGFVQGDELAVPGSMILKPLANQTKKAVCFTDLDWNGHMNNCRYLDWIADSLPSTFHKDHPIQEFSICYLSEARETEQLFLQWELSKDGMLCVDGCRENSNSSAGHGRVFSARVLF